MKYEGLLNPSGGMILRLSLNLPPTSPQDLLSDGCQQGVGGGVPGAVMWIKGSDSIKQEMGEGAQPAKEGKPSVAISLLQHHSPKS